MRPRHVRNGEVRRAHRSLSYYYPEPYQDRPPIGWFVPVHDNLPSQRRCIVVTTPLHHRCIFITPQVSFLPSACQRKKCGFPSSFLRLGAGFRACEFSHASAHNIARYIVGASVRDFVGCWAIWREPARDRFRESEAAIAQQNQSLRVIGLFLAKTARTQPRRAPKNSG